MFLVISRLCGSGGSGGKRYDKSKEGDLSYLGVLSCDFASGFTKKAYFRWIFLLRFCENLLYLWCKFWHKIITEAF